MRSNIEVLLKRCAPSRDAHHPEQGQPSCEITRKNRRRPRVGWTVPPDSVRFDGLCVNAMGSGYLLHMARPQPCC